MKLLALLLATAGLSGCVGYGYPYAGGAGYYGQGAYYGQGVYTQPYVVDPSITIYGGTHYRSAPVPAYGPRGRGDRDRDRDGIPNRVDRDRDGDGVPNSVDRRPMDPRRI